MTWEKSQIATTASGFLLHLEVAFILLDTENFLKAKVIILGSNNQHYITWMNQDVKF